MTIRPPNVIRNHIPYIFKEYGDRNLITFTFWSMGTDPPVLKPLLPTSEVFLKSRYIIFLIIIIIIIIIHFSFTKLAIKALLSTKFSEGGNQSQQGGMRPSTDFIQIRDLRLQKSVWSLYFKLMANSGTGKCFQNHMYVYLRYIYKLVLVAKYLEMNGRQTMLVKFNDTIIWRGVWIEKLAVHLST